MDLWTTASAATEDETYQRLLAEARVATAHLWPFLSKASTEADFANRKALIAEQYEAALEPFVGENEALRERVRADLDAILDGDFKIAREAALQAEANQYIHQEGNEWVITQKGTGKILSRHPSEEKANAAFRAMEWSKHSGSVDGLDFPEGGTDKVAAKADFYHHEDGSHRSTAPTASGSDLARFEKGMKAHRADGHKHFDDPEGWVEGDDDKLGSRKTAASPLRHSHATDVDPNHEHSMIHVHEGGDKEHDHREKGGSGSLFTNYKRLGDDKQASLTKGAPYGIPKEKGGDSESNDKRMEDCVKKVKAKGNVDNAYAVCKASLGFTKDSARHDGLTDALAGKDIGPYYAYDEQLRQGYIEGFGRGRLAYMRKHGIGIPYARNEQDPDGSWVKVCPICGERVKSVEQKDFESHTGKEYAEHYEREHAGKEGVKTAAKPRVNGDQCAKCGSKNLCTWTNDGVTICEDCGTNHRISAGDPFFYGNGNGTKIPARMRQSSKTAAFIVVDDKGQKVSGPYDSKDEAQAFIDNLSSGKDQHGVKDTDADTDADKDSDKKPPDSAKPQDKDGGDKDTDDDKDGDKKKPPFLKKKESRDFPQASKTAVGSVSAQDAQAVFDAVKQQFRSWLEAGDAGPTLKKDYDWFGGMPTPYAILWEGGPYNWVDYVPFGGKEEEFGFEIEPAIIPASVYCEPVTSFILGIFPSGRTGSKLRIANYDTSCAICDHAKDQHGPNGCADCRYWGYPASEIKHEFQPHELEYDGDDSSSQGRAWRNSSKQAVGDPNDPWIEQQPIGRLYCKRCGYEGSLDDFDQTSTFIQCPKCGANSGDPDEPIGERTASLKTAIAYEEMDWSDDGALHQRLADNWDSWENQQVIDAFDELNKRIGYYRAKKVWDDATNWYDDTHGASGDVEASRKQADQRDYPHVHYTDEPQMSNVDAKTVEYAYRLKPGDVVEGGKTVESVEWAPGEQDCGIKFTDGGYVVRSILTEVKLQSRASKTADWTETVYSDYQGGKTVYWTFSDGVRIFISAQQAGKMIDQGANLVPTEEARKAAAVMPDLFASGPVGRRVKHGDDMGTVEDWDLNERGGMIFVVFDNGTEEEFFDNTVSGPHLDELEWEQPDGSFKIEDNDYYGSRKTAEDDINDYDEPPTDAGVRYCNHDVPGGCPECRHQWAIEEAEKDPNWKSPYGPVEEDLAPYGPAWQDEQRERHGGSLKVSSFRDKVVEAGHRVYNDTAGFDDAMSHTEDYQLDYLSEMYADAKISGEGGEAPPEDSLAEAVAMHVYETYDPKDYQPGGFFYKGRKTARPLGTAQLFYSSDSLEDAKTWAADNAYVLAQQLAVVDWSEPTAADAFTGWGLQFPDRVNLEHRYAVMSTSQAKDIGLPILFDTSSKPFPWEPGFDINKHWGQRAQAANPYMPGGNPYAVSAPPTPGTPDDMLEGPPPPMNDYATPDMIPPTTTKPRQMPNSGDNQMGNELMDQQDRTPADSSSQNDKQGT